MTSVRDMQQPAAVQPASSSGAAVAADFAVMIVASGSLRGGGMVHAVGVTQPVQSWTVLRSQEDFSVVSEALGQVLGGEVPTCPSLVTDHGDNNLEAVVKARNALQEWLAAILMHPGARESPAIRNFLTYGANMIPPQFDGVSWVNFTPQGSGIANTPTSSSNSHDDAAVVNDDVDDMDMDVMFDAGDDEDGVPQDYGDDDEDDFVPASVRYKPTDEAITEEEEMDFMKLAGEVEMVDDVGSLAQSLGASHLGRSLQLQAEKATKAMHAHQHQNHQHYKPMQGLPQGLSLLPPQAPSAPAASMLSTTSAAPATATATVPQGGGIASAMEQAIEGLADGFHPMTPQSAPRLDSFRMIKVIGKGSFGKVFLVKEVKTDHMFALKVLRKDHIIRRNQVEHTKTERSVLGYVKHPFIVGLNMAFQSKDKLYFVLDYCAGGELFFHLGRLGKFPEPRARFYAAEIACAISYVHNLGIIYRDLKPENVLLDARGHIRLTDFGLSKEGISNSSSGAYSFCGTPEYLAPEILNRQGHGRAVDWWSLGALLYEMLTGLPPFYCQDRERLFEKIRKSELHYPASLSTHAKGLLKGLLTKDPNTRLGSGPNDGDDVQEHIFFAEIEWDKLSRGEVPPPWKPQIRGSMDTSQFDKEFTNMPIFSPQSMQRAPVFGTTPRENPFEGFTFTDRILYGPGAQTESR